MPRRLITLAVGETYHIFNRGVEKRKVFMSQRDHQRFMETIQHYQNPTSRLSRKPKLIKPSENKELIEILAYCLMPNHFHLLLKQKAENGISVFMAKLLNSYTKYFNIKNDRVGALFQGQFKAVHVDSDEQLLHLSRYIHLNPYVAELTDDLNLYPWSSYQTYIGKKSNELVSSDEVLCHFSSKKDYESFVLDQADYGLMLDKIKHYQLD